MAEPAYGGVWARHLTHRAVQDALAHALTIRHVHPAGEVGSTQDVALRLAVDGATNGTVVVADRQTAGRGRGGRRWDDHPDGGTLALTVLLDVDAVPHVELVPHAFGLAMLDAFASVLPSTVDVRLKWPNDVVHRAADGSMRKLCGILIERDRAADRDVLLGGVGVDVDLRDVRDVEGRTCLAALAGSRPDPVRLLAAVVGALDAALGLLARPVALLDRYRSRSDTIGREVRVEIDGGAPIVGLAEDVDDSGRLVVTTAARRHAILSGTVRDAEGAEESRE